MNCREAEPFLHPYLDSELDAASCATVQQHLATCASCGQHFRDLQDLRREIADARLEFTPRPALARKVAAAERRLALRAAPWWGRPFAWAGATAAIAAMLAILIVPTNRTRTISDEREIVDAHIRSLMASHLVDVPSSDHHTVKPWFQGKLNFSPDVPDLAAEGFVLSGGRLDVLNGAPAAAIVYRRREHVINVFVAAGAGADRGPQAASEHGYNVVDWTKGGLSYRAVSDLNSAELRTFAELVRLH
jgi:anti-sigma factor RsiW